MVVGMFTTRCVIILVVQAFVVTKVMMVVPGDIRMILVLPGVGHVDLLGALIVSVLTMYMINL